MRISYTLTPQSRVSAGRTGQVQNVRDTHELIPGSVVRGALAAVWWGPTEARFQPASQAAFDDLFARRMDVHAAVPRLTRDGYCVEAAFEPLSWVRCKYRREQGCETAWHDQAVALLSGGDDWLRTCPTCGDPVELSKVAWRVPDTWSVSTVRTALVDGVAENDLLFTRRAMLAEVSYTGTLRLSAEPSRAVRDWLLAPKVIRVGGQRSTMGACRWEAAIADDPLPRINGACAAQLLSPCILVDRFGAPSLDLAETLTHLLNPGSAGHVQHVWTRPEVVTGWHSIAGLPKPSEWAVAAGSVALITGATVRTAELLAAGIGLRRAEGFGQLRIIPIRPNDPVAIGLADSRAVDLAAPTAEPTSTPEPARVAAPSDPLSVLQQLLFDAVVRERTLRAVLAEARRIKQLRDGGFPELIVAQRVSGLVNKPWMRDLSGEAQQAVADVLTSAALADYLLKLESSLGQGGAR